MEDWCSFLRLMWVRKTDQISMLQNKILNDTSVVATLLELPEKYLINTRVF